MSGYTFALTGLRDVQDPNYDAVEVYVEISQSGDRLTDFRRVATGDRCRRCRRQNLLKSGARRSAKARSASAASGDVSR